MMQTESRYICHKRPIPDAHVDRLARRLNAIKRLTIECMAGPRAGFRRWFSGWRVGDWGAQLEWYMTDSDPDNEPPVDHYTLTVWRLVEKGGAPC